MWLLYTDKAPFIMISFSSSTDGQHYSTDSFQSFNSSLLLVSAINLYAI